MRSAVKKTLFLLAAALCAMSICSAVAIAGSSDAIIQDCNQDGSLDGKYSKSALQNALKNIPKDVSQYSDCESLISQALLTALNDKHHGRGGGHSGSAAATTTPAQRKKYEAKVAKDSRLSSAGPIASTDGAKISRAGGQTLASSTAPGIPTALIVAVVGLLLLFGADLAGRLGKMPRVHKILPKTGRRGGDLPD
jgi:hypothetical protein